jgi:hypothetical protein
MFVKIFAHDVYYQFFYVINVISCFEISNLCVTSEREF